jgi:hypothetical protein
MSQRRSDPGQRFSDRDILRRPTAARRQAIPSLPKARLLRDCRRILLSKPVVYNGFLVMLCRSGPEVTPTRSASEGRKLFPRLRFGLVRDASILAGSRIGGLIDEEQQSLP